MLRPGLSAVRAYVLILTRKVPAIIPEHGSRQYFQPVNLRPRTQINYCAFRFARESTRPYHIRPLSKIGATHTSTGADAAWRTAGAGTTNSTTGAGATMVSAGAEATSSTPGAG